MADDNYDMKERKMKEIKGYNKWFEGPVDEGGDPFYWENGYTYVRMRVCMRVCASERIVMILPSAGGIT